MYRPIASTSDLYTMKFLEYLLYNKLGVFKEAMFSLAFTC